ncbi:hypothetical protein [Streptomyces sp. 11x1]|uniref:hypothetical protein n=1 Tax=Streptomyces sp. 11x1 TaxID=3038642 RepID=UPI00292FDAE3|nr:hypothetical protein [Streptomyces sp. 11x1]WNZ06231.1 hypothetical protein P8T65_00530 [Streptomyces sp. 11x1]
MHTSLALRISRRPLRLGIAHEALHRQIGTRVPVLDMNDLPAPVRLNAVLHELLSLL